MKRRSLVLILALVIVFGAVQAASAAGFGFGGLGMGNKASQGDFEKQNSAIQEMELTEEQVESIKENRDEIYKETRDLRIKFMDLKHELKQAQFSQDEDAIEAKMDEINEVRSQMEEIRQNHREECSSILTEEQKNMCGDGSGMNGKGYRGFKGE